MFILVEPSYLSIYLFPVVEFELVFSALLGVVVCGPVVHGGHVGVMRCKSCIHCMKTSTQSEYTVNGS